MVTKDDDYCYICGDSFQKQAKVAVKRRPVSALTNLVFLISLGFTAYCFLAEHKLSLPMTLAVSSALLLLRILAEHFVNKNVN
ncbi:MAG TPA: hypothetical protein VME17_24890 [Bryobacteraceae bacterium]|nr:hypothetical protein [Bryobacteraceae bacterium]